MGSLFSGSSRRVKETVTTVCDVMVWGVHNTRALRRRPVVCRKLGEGSFKEITFDLA